MYPFQIRICNKLFERITYMKKKISINIILLMCLSLIFSVSAFANDISVYVDGELVHLKDATGATVYPFIQNGTTYVPLRGISETLDCEVIWDGNNNTILIYKDIQLDNTVFRNKTDEIKLYVDNKLVELKDVNGTIVKPFIKNGTTYVPLRGVSQALGCWVRWNGQTKIVYIYMNEVPPDGVSMSENKPSDMDWQTETYYEENGDRLEIDEGYYTNALNFKFYNSYASFNLNSKFKSVSMIVGGYYGWNSRDTTISFVVDDKIIDTYTVTSNSTIEEINVDLNMGMKLKIIIDNPQVRIGEIVFWGE